jgi:glycosyltransferase involved in cell wall biosynthesis
MRVLLLTKNFPPRTCGVGDYACRLAETLTAAGNEVVVLTEPAGGRGGFPFALRELSLEGWSDLRPLLSEIEQAAPDCVQLEYAGYAWNRWATPWWLNALLLGLRSRKIPVRIGLHETAIRMRQHPLQIPVALAQWAHIGMLFAAAETVAVNMPSRVTLLGGVFPWWRGRLRYRPNSSNIPVVPLAASERIGLRRERGVGSGEAVVATFGMFHRAKNYDALIQAVKIVRTNFPVKLWMLGDIAMAAPDYRAQLEALARDVGIEGHVWWSGRLEAAEISRFLQAADVFVLPQPDGHLTRSGAFMAAAAHGLPVVAVHNPLGRDQQEFTHGANIWLVGRSAPEPMAQGIYALAGDPTVAGLVGRNLRRLYESKFDWPQAVAVVEGSAPATGTIRPGVLSSDRPGRAAASSATARAAAK